MSHATRIRILVAPLVLAALCATTALGQNAKPMKENVRAAGTIKDAGMGMLHVVGAGGDQWLVKLEANPRNVSFVGTAEPSWLQPGLLVRFSGRIDRRGKLVDPIGMMSVISLREGYQIGIMPEGGRGKDGPGLFEEPKPEKTPVKKPAGPPEPIAILVIGRLTTIKNGKFTIDAGGKQLKGELEEDARISIDVADLSWVRAGDKVELQGWAYPQQKNLVHAQDITITASTPLASDKKRPPTKEGKEGKEKDKEKDKEKEPAKPVEKPD